MRRINYDSPTAIKAFLAEHGFAMQKKFGQNFLINPSARINLVKQLRIEEDDEVWEVGAGLGAMTSLLLERGAQVSAFELDRGFCAVLKEMFADEKKFTLIEGDVLDTWKLSAQKELHPCGRSLLGNLPYTIGAKLLGDFAEHHFFFTRMVVTVQREVARRIAAQAGDKDYSSLSVLLSRSYNTKLLSPLKGESFFPVPHVESQGVLLELKDSAQRTKDSACFAPLVRALFSSRRKTVRNNLQAFLKARNISCAAIDILEDCGIDGGERAERLTPDEFARIAHHLSCTLC
ncbi:MAG: 16S rRNA (adenine(1518)-N(6)/adenine(1519)-N(6))-dimethyltransferase RsmA [Spirochaetaceae bacterium]|jgi:16S rRNA (adenine1518-N6/adenine1519-N6)-dimethyltransferase|nr:16S rRNA (adenine(1518)-N(6)/adenine(1519)-N(6))-dimethyltransferase RsmA [Spirochaetaceae bacterium]